jgi:gamma-glutamyltranspeptidase/glutathione hydrolase
MRFLILLALACAPMASAADRITGRDFATRSEVIAPHAMAATSHPLATQIALEVMKQGGSAVDAAIAANAALGLMEPTGNGMGGDLFAIVWDPKTNKLYGYNGSGRSPRSLTLDYFQKQGLTDIPPLGPLPVRRTQPTSLVVRACSRTRSSSSTVCGRNAFSTSGRSKAIRTVPCSRARW